MAEYSVVKELIEDAKKTGSDTSELNPQRYEHTYEVMYTVTAFSPDPNCKGPSAFDIDRKIKQLLLVPIVTKIKTSPNRVPYSCPTEGCTLRWIHRVGEDDLKQTPQYCAYCARNAKLAQYSFQKESGEINEAFRILEEEYENDNGNEDFDEAEYEERTNAWGDKSDDFNNRIDQHVFCYRQFVTLDEKEEHTDDSVRVEYKTVPLIKGEPFTV